MPTSRSSMIGSLSSCSSKVFSFEPREGVLGHVVHLTDADRLALVDELLAPVRDEHVCMNFRAMRVLKNSRDCVSSPSSMIFFFSLKRDVRQRPRADVERRVLALVGLAEGLRASFSIFESVFASRRSCSSPSSWRPVIFHRESCSPRLRLACGSLGAGLLAAAACPCLCLRLAAGRREGAGLRARCRRPLPSWRSCRCAAEPAVGSPAAAPRGGRPRRSARSSGAPRRTTSRPCPCARRGCPRSPRHLGDVLLEHAAPLGVALQRARRSQMCAASLRPHSWIASFISLEELVVVGHRLLGLARERHPHAGQVHGDGHRRDRQAALGLLQLVAAPVGLVDALADRARLGLVLQRHAVGEAHDFGRLVERQVAAVGEPHLDHERIAAVHARAAASSTRRTRPWEAALEALDEQRLADRHDAVAGGAIIFTCAERLVQPLESSPWIRSGAASSGSPCAIWQISPATAGETRENSSHEHLLDGLASASRSASCGASRARPRAGAA